MTNSQSTPELAGAIQTRWARRTRDAAGRRCRSVSPIAACGLVIESCELLASVVAANQIRRGPKGDHRPRDNAVRIRRHDKFLSVC